MQETFIVWRGTERIVVDNPDNLRENKERFDSCVHRTPEEIEIPIQTCCSTVFKKGHKCLKLNIQFLSPSVCFSCADYQSRQTEKSEDSGKP